MLLGEYDLIIKRSSGWYSERPRSFSTSSGGNTSGLLLKNRSGACRQGRLHVAKVVMQPNTFLSVADKHTFKQSMCTEDDSGESRHC